MTEKLNNYYSQMLPALEQEMKTVLQWQTEAPVDDHFGMMHYHLGWRDSALQPLESSGGKRIRPILCLIACAAAGGDWSRALPAAAAVELLHNFSLVHDDIEDDSPTRRGRPTVWQLIGVPKAINVGDGMLALSHIALLRLAERGVPAEQVVHSAIRFDQTCVWLTEGQYADMSFEDEANVSVQDYLNMIKGKTAVLLALSAELGALVAGVSDETREHYRHFGRELGLAFQVKDDILGIWGDEAAIGKSAVSDIVTRKKTLPVLYGLQNSAALRALYAEPDYAEESVPQVVALLDQTGAKPYAQQKAAEYSKSALFHLESAGPTGDAGQALFELTDLLLNRDL